MAKEIRSGLKRRTFITALQALCGAIGVYFFVNWSYLALTDEETRNELAADPFSLILVLGIPLVIGIAFLFLAYKNQMLLRLYKRYEPAITKAHGGRIAEIAKALNTTEQKVLCDLEFLISKGLLENADIDEAKHALVILNEAPAEKKKKGTRR
jgi:hypothetical protein